jgi:hypothetical protein
MVLYYSCSRFHGNIVAVICVKIRVSILGRFVDLPYSLVLQKVVFDAIIQSNLRWQSAHPKRCTRDSYCTHANQMNFQGIQQHY